MDLDQSVPEQTCTKGQNQLSSVKLQSSVLCSVKAPFSAPFSPQ